MNARAFWLSALVGGLVIGFLGNLPLLNFVNCLLCIWVWLGAGLGLQAEDRGFLRGMTMIDSVRKEMEAANRLDPNYEEAGAMLERLERLHRSERDAFSNLRLTASPGQYVPSQPGKEWMARLVSLVVSFGPGTLVTIMLPNHQRVVRRNVRKGLVDEKDYERYLKSLPDVADQAVPVESEVEHVDTGEDD